VSSTEAPPAAVPRSVFPVAPDARYFEDYHVGDVYLFGPVDVTQEEVIEFARRYDPQSFHVDPAAARQSMFGGLIASGWHTAALMMRVLVDNFVSTVAGLGSPGVDQLRWLAPVRPGDRLRMRVAVTEARRSQSKRDRGIVRSRVEVLNQADVVVMSVEAVSLMRCRKPGPV